MSASYCGKPVVAIGVSMMPGSTNATLIPSPVTSWANDSVNASSANLDAPYALPAEKATRPAIDVILMMHPEPRFRIAGRISLTQRTAPK